jgi:hypothetical protein
MGSRLINETTDCLIKQFATLTKIQKGLSYAKLV